jgi:urocanate hydratase
LVSEGDGKNTGAEGWEDLLGEGPTIFFRTALRKNFQKRHKRRKGMDGKRERIRAPRGTKLNCKGWQQEAALRMLMNNLDPEVAEAPEELIVYMNAKAARTWKDYYLTVQVLKSLENDETLVIQSGRPVAKFKTFEDAPRVIMACSFIVPENATHETFRDLLGKGLTMQGGLTAASWFYIGAQGVIGTTYHTLAAVAHQSLKVNSLRGKIVLTSGLGGAGRSQPLAITLNEGVGIVVEVDKKRIQRSMRSDIKVLNTWTDNLDEAVKMAQEARDKGNPLSIGLLGNAADIYPEFVKRQIVPDIVTDQTSAHDELNGYIPAGISFEEALELRMSDPDRYMKMSYQSLVEHVQAMNDLQRMGSVAFEFGNWIRKQAQRGGLGEAYRFPGFIDGYIRPLFCQGIGGFRYIALSGDQKDIYRIDKAISQLFPRMEGWIKMAQKWIPFQGLPARICWLGHGERTEAGLHINELVSKGEVEAPVVLAKCLLDAGSTASPDTQTGNMKDGSDVVGDWPILKGLLHVATGATWVSMISEPEIYAAGAAVVADGTEKAKRRIERALTADTGLGVTSFAHAGYESAIRTVKEKDIKALI